MEKWEPQEDEYGRTYYLNSVTGESVWQVPEAAGGKKSSPWIESNDEHGRTYYYNTEVITPPPRPPPLPLPLGPLLPSPLSCTFHSLSLPPVFSPPPSLFRRANQDGRTLRRTGPRTAFLTGGRLFRTAPGASTTTTPRCAREVIAGSGERRP